MLFVQFYFFIINSFSLQLPLLAIELSQVGSGFRRQPTTVAWQAIRFIFPAQTKTFADTKSSYSDCWQSSFFDVKSSQSSISIEHQTDNKPISGHKFACPSVLSVVTVHNRNVQSNAKSITELDFRQQHGHCSPWEIIHNKTSASRKKALNQTFSPVHIGRTSNYLLEKSTTNSFQN